MNRGEIEQFGPPQEIYSRPVSMFVADFIGSPPMNFLHFHSGVARGSGETRLGDAVVRMPVLHEDVAPRDLALGVRPEHVAFDDASSLRGSVYGSEYLGTNQIVTINTAFGQVKARTKSTGEVRAGENVGLRFAADRLSLFDKQTGRAVRSALFEGAHHG
jgi:multiple sugar transport system ATP-binding protein